MDTRKKHAPQDAAVDWVEKIKLAIRYAQIDKRATNCMAFRFNITPDRMQEYKKLQEEIARLIPNEYDRPTIALHIRGKNRLHDKRPDLGLLGGMGPLSDAHIINELMAKGNQDNAHVLLVSSPPPRQDVEPVDKFKRHKRFRMDQLRYLGKNNCKKYTMLSNTAHLHEKGFRFMVGDALGVAFETGRFINLVKSIATDTKNKNTQKVLVLGTTEAAIGNLYPKALGKIATFQFGTNAPDKKTLPASQKKLQDYIDATKTSPAEANKIRDAFITDLVDWISTTKPSHVLLACTEIPLFLGMKQGDKTNLQVLKEKLAAKDPQLAHVTFIDSEAEMVTVLDANKKHLEKPKVKQSEAKSKFEIEREQEQKLVDELTKETGKYAAHLDAERIHLLTKMMVDSIRDEKDIHQANIYIDKILGKSLSAEEKANYAAHDFDSRLDYLAQIYQQIYKEVAVKDRTQNELKKDLLENFAKDYAVLNQKYKIIQEVKTILNYSINADKLTNIGVIFSDRGKRNILSMRRDSFAKGFCKVIDAIFHFLQLHPLGVKGQNYSLSMFQKLNKAGSTLYEPPQPPKLNK